MIINFKYDISRIQRFIRQFEDNGPVKVLKKACRPKIARYTKNNDITTFLGIKHSAIFCLTYFELCIVRKLH